MKPGLTALAAAIVLSASPAAALNTRTWISGHGVDQTGCGPIASPCRTLQYAVDGTVAGGEIDVLDGAGYGSLSAHKSITIINDGAGVAGVLATSGGNALEFNGTGSDVIVLRGLTIEGAGIGANGIVFENGTSLTISNCTIQGFVGNDNDHGNGVLLKPPYPNPFDLVVSNTTISNNSYIGLSYIPPTQPVASNVVIDHVTATGNLLGIAFYLSNLSTSGSNMTVASISNTVASNNKSVGIQLFGAKGVNGPINLFTGILDTVVATGNGAGISVSGGGTTYIKNVTSVKNSSIDLSTTGTQTIYSFKNNMIANAQTANTFAFSPY